MIPTLITWYVMYACIQSNPLSEFISVKASHINKFNSKYYLLNNLFNWNFLKIILNWNEEESAA